MFRDFRSFFFSSVTEESCGREKGRSGRDEGMESVGETHHYGQRLTADLRLVVRDSVWRATEEEAQLVKQTNSNNQTTTTTTDLLWASNSLCFNLGQVGGTALAPEPTESSAALDFHLIPSLPVQNKNGKLESTVGTGNQA